MFLQHVFVQYSVLYDLCRCMAESGCDAIVPVCGDCCFVRQDVGRLRNEGIPDSKDVSNCVAIFFALVGWYCFIIWQYISVLQFYCLLSIHIGLYSTKSLH